MSSFKLIAVDTEKRHVTVSYSDNVEQTMCDCPLTSIEERDAFLSAYGDIYEAEIASEQSKAVASDITQGVGEVITPAV